MMPITKQKFVQILDTIRQVHDFTDDIASLKNKYNSPLIKHSLIDNFFIDNFEDEVIDLLALLTRCKSNDDYGTDISYFIYDLDFGRKYKDGMVVENGKNVDFSSADKLYDYLSEVYENERQEQIR